MQDRTENAHRDTPQESNAQAQQAAQAAPAQRARRRKLTPLQRRRRARRVVKIIVWLLILAGLAVAGLWAYDTYLKPQEEVATPYAQALVRQGALDVHVYGSGAIVAANQPTVFAQSEGQLTDLRASIGDAVTAGQILAVLQNDALDDEITTLEYDLWNLDNTISTTSAGTGVSSIVAPASGRVKQILAEPGDDALAVYRRLGSVAMLSTDGRMKVQLEVSEDVQLAYGEIVTVTGPDFVCEGSVSDLYLQGTRAVVTVTDDTLPMDVQVTVTTQAGQAAGSGTLQINKPMAVSAFGGTIKAVRVKEGDLVDRRTTLFTLEDSPITLKIENLRIQRENAAATLADAREKRENLIVRAPVDGVVASVAVAQGDEIVSGAALCSILQGEDMLLTIAVDELDVVQVAEGQSVNITVDALPDLVLAGSVQKIAPVGTSSGGVSTYDVWLGFDAAGTGVRPGMNASGQVQVAHVADALYVPVEALMTINNQSFVLVADSTGAAEGGAVMPFMQADGEGMGAQGFAPGQGADGAAQRGGDRVRGEGTGQGGAAMGGQTAGGEDFAQRMAQRQAAMGGSAVTTGGAAQTGAMRAVTVGLMNDDYVEILSGLSAGEVVLYQTTSGSTGNQFTMRAVQGGGMAIPMMGF